MKSVHEEGHCHRYDESTEAYFDLILLLISNKAPQT